MIACQWDEAHTAHIGGLQFPVDFFEQP
jgi:hypothetical protein